MPPEPVPADPGWDDDLAWLDRDPERESWLDRAREHDEPPLEEEYEDYEPLTAEELAGIREAAADELLAVGAASLGPAGPGPARLGAGLPRRVVQPGGRVRPGDGLRRAARLRAAGGRCRRRRGRRRVRRDSEAELVGIMCAWDRVEAHAAARKLAAIGELSRRNPEPGDAEFTADQVANALGESRFRAGELTGTAGHLDTRLPGTKAALRDGTVSLSKARIIATATGLLDPAEAAAAEAGVLDRAGRLTPGGLRAAIARAVIEAAPDKARKRRETAARFARVERWAEDSGNAALAGRELPPDQALAADERITARARELKAAGLEGGMDELRARALLDLLLGQDSRPGQDQDSTPRRRARGVRQPGHPDRPAGHLDPPGRPARRAGRARPGRPLADPRPGRRRRAQPEDHLVPDRHRQHGPRRRPRLRPPRTQEPQETRRTRPARTGRGSRSPRPAGTARPADTAPGGCAPPDPGRT